ncbi:MAG: transposase [Spartobacteria bacterium]
MAIHTFGEYLDFHPHLHALAADGPFGYIRSNRERFPGREFFGNAWGFW